MTFNCTQYGLGIKFPSPAIQESQAFKEKTKMSTHQKGGNHFLFSGQENKGGRNELPRLLFSRPDHERSGFPGSPCHVTKKN